MQAYIGETACFLGTRYTDHSGRDKNLAVLEHTTNVGHHVSLDNIHILAQDSRQQSRKIREALEIYKARPSLNRDQGYEIDPVLLQLLPQQLPHSISNSGYVTGRVFTRRRVNSL